MSIYRWSKKKRKIKGEDWNELADLVELLKVREYVLEGAENPLTLSLLEEAIWRDDTITRIFKGLDDRQIGCLGLAYMGNIKVHILSPLMRLLKIWNKHSVRVNDPLYSNGEIKEITDCETFVFPSGLENFDIIMLLVDHDEYRDVDESELIRKTQNCDFIFDNTGLWKDIPFKCPYYLAGAAGWMIPLKGGSLK